MLRVLVANKIGPILLIAFTNHALDNILAQLLEKNITKKVVRLGSRSSNETVAQYSLDEIMRTRPKEREGSKAYAQMKELQQEMEKLMDTMTRGAVEVDKLEKYLDENFPQHHHLIHNPQPWILQLFEESTKWEEAQEAGSHATRQARTLFEYWHRGCDLAFLTPPPAISAAMKEKGKKNMKKATKAANQFSALSVAPTRAEGGEGNPVLLAAETEHLDPTAQWQLRLEEYFANVPLQDGVPPRPTRARGLADLLDDPDVWDMSLRERQTLCAFWLATVRDASYDDQVERYIFLKVSHHMARIEWNELMDKV